MQQGLHENGYKVDALYSDIYAVKKYLYCNKPNLIIADVMLGNSNIFDLLKNGSYANIPFLFMTSSEDDALYQLSHSVNYSHYLIKPFAAISLDAAIKILLKSVSNTPQTDIDGIKVKGVFGEKVTLKEAHIYFVQAQKNNVILHTKTEQFTLKASLLSYEQKLSNAFVRINRAYLLNKNHIKQINFDKMEIVTDAGIVPIGSHYKVHAEKLHAELKGYV